VEETLERLAFDLSLRALERQERVVEELHARVARLTARFEVACACLILAILFGR